MDELRQITSVNHGNERTSNDEVVRVLTDEDHNKLAPWKSVDSHFCNIWTQFQPLEDTHALVQGLNLNPGEDGFLFWYNISNTLPLIAASLGPISNLNSIAALVDPWRVRKIDHTHIGDYHWILTMNAISLFLGCTANFSLLLNFSGRVNYMYAQYLSIIGWYVAWALLFTLLVATRFVYFKSGEYAKSGGYYHALFTAIFYFISATLLLINFIGHKMGRYPPSFNLTKNQRRIMFQNLLLIVWIGLGGLLFAFLIHLRYTDAIYYCLVTILTIGLGDIIPNKDLSRALILPYALIGVVYVGLIVTTMAKAVLNHKGMAGDMNELEYKRKKLYGKLLERRKYGRPLSSMDSFLLQHKLRKKVKRSRKMKSLFLTILLFNIFWLGGSAIFYATEHEWSYFHALYFCSLCVLTIGYGDFTPLSAAGRAFFIIWAVTAVPMMTMLVSSLSDNLFVWIMDVGDAIVAVSLGMRDVRIEYINWWKLRFSRGLLHLRNTLTMLHRNDDQDAQEEHKDEELESEEEADVEYMDQQDLQSQQSFIQSEDNDSIGNCCSVLNSNVSAKAEGYADNDMASNSRVRGNSRRLEENQIADNELRQEKVADIAERMLTIVKELHSLTLTEQQNPDHRFTYDDWKRIISSLGGSDLDNLNGEFWASDDSPLRLPLPEIRYFMRECMKALHHSILEILEISEIKPERQLTTDNDTN